MTPPALQGTTGREYRLELNSNPGSPTPAWRPAALDSEAPHRDGWGPLDEALRAAEETRHEAGCLRITSRPITALAVEAQW